MRFPPALDPRRWWADAVTADRLVLAAKTAVAATLAWYLAPLVAAEQALTGYTDGLRALEAHEEPLDAWEAAVSLRRVIAACGPFSDPDADTVTP
jgi:DNA-binding transcriptional LysR family regulator